MAEIIRASNTTGGDSDQFSVPNKDNHVTVTCTNLGAAETGTVYQLGADGSTWCITDIICTNTASSQKIDRIGVFKVTTTNTSSATVVGLHRDGYV